VLTLLAVLVQAVPSAPLAHADIWFDARATVADFQGRATTVTGELVGGAGPAGSRGWVEVRWADIDTQNGTRNGHMLKTVDAERFPVIRFDVTAVRPGIDSVAGTLALHGVTKDVVWPVSVQAGGDTVSVAADFPVDMRDYGIKPPVRFVIARMGAVVTVHVRLVFRKNQTRG
jgi:polyisoprenoid-binding protein YceI